MAEVNDLSNEGINENFGEVVSDNKLPFFETSSDVFGKSTNNIHKQMRHHQKIHESYNIASLIFSVILIILIVGLLSDLTVNILDIYYN